LLNRYPLDTSSQYHLFLLYINSIPFSIDNFYIELLIDSYYRIVEFILDTVSFNGFTLGIYIKLISLDMRVAVASNFNLLYLVMFARNRTLFLN